MNLPLFAQIAVDRLAADPSLRSEKQLDALLAAYAFQYAMPVEREVADAARALCRRRFPVMAD